ncbi:MAG: hypothetical protein R3E62_01585 [Pseudomonadales bacterium]
MKRSRSKQRGYVGIAALRVSVTRQQALCDASCGPLVSTLINPE